MRPGERGAPVAGARGPVARAAPVARGAPVAPRPRTLSGHGIELQAPAGWSARLYLRHAGPGELSHPALHAATLPLPPGRGDYGSAVTPLLGPADALVALLEFGPSALGTALFAAQGLPRPLAAEYSPRALQRTLPGQAGYQRFFTWRGRAWCLYVVLGSYQRRWVMAGHVGGLLDGVRVTAPPQVAREERR